MKLKENLSKEEKNDALCFLAFLTMNASRTGATQTTQWVSCTLYSQLSIVL